MASPDDLAAKMCRCASTLPVSFGTRLPSRPSRSSGPSTRCTGMRGSVIGSRAPAWMSLNSTFAHRPDGRDDRAVAEVHHARELQQFVHELRAGQDADDETAALPHFTV